MFLIFKHSNTMIMASFMLTRMKKIKSKLKNKNKQQQTRMTTNLL